MTEIEGNHKDIESEEVTDIKGSDRIGNEKWSAFVKNMIDNPNLDMKEEYEKQIAMNRRHIEEVDDRTLSIVKGILVKYGAKTIELPKSELAPLDFTLVVSGMYKHNYYIAIGEISNYIHGEFGIYAKEFDQDSISSLTSQKCTYTDIKHQPLQID